MIIEQVDATKRSSFYMALNKYTQSYAKSGVAFIINAQSEYFGTIDIFITGKRGTGQKNILIAYDEPNSAWVAYCDGYKFNMLSLSEISVLVKSQIAKLGTVLSKI